jgi:hypothetical protein
MHYRKDYIMIRRIRVGWGVGVEGEADMGSL